MLTLVETYLRRNEKYKDMQQFKVLSNLGTYATTTAKKKQLIQTHLGGVDWLHRQDGVHGRLC